MMNMKRIAILNDIHGNYLFLERILRDLKYQNIDEYIIGGDLVSDGFENELVVNKVKELTSNVILGNRDEDIVNYDLKSWKENDRFENMLYAFKQLSKSSFDFLKKLPKYKIINIENKRICISHGSPYNIKDAIRPYNMELFDKLIKDFDCDIYLFAHTHQQFDITYKNRYFINSGAINCSSCGQPGSYYGILTIENDNISYEQRVYEFDFEEVKKYYLESDYYQECQEWANLVLYTLKTGEDKCCPFIDSYDNNLSYNANFIKYMKDNDLKIL